MGDYWQSGSFQSASLLRREEIAWCRPDGLPENGKGVAGDATMDRDH